MWAFNTIPLVLIKTEKIYHNANLNWYCGKSKQSHVELALVGESNAREFGTLKIKEECKALLKMDAYQNLKENTQYPATLITVGMNDPRVRQAGHPELQVNEK